jgi:hypothetical protein
VFRAAQQPTRREIGGVEQPLGAQWLESNVFEAAVASADDGSAIDFELRAPGARYDEDPTELEPRRSSAPSPVSVKGFTPRSPKIRSPHRGLTRNDRSDRRMFAELAASMVLPMLCIVQGEGNAERLAACIDEGTFRTINDDDDDAAMLAAAREVAGGTFVVRLEDPSRVLGWILRRLEEGSTVVVQTRARTMEGAHRTLLGLAVTPGAEAWLAVHRVGWLHENGSGDWTLALRNG